jgi:iron complex outermembrane receptor protein
VDERLTLSLGVRWNEEEKEQYLSAPAIPYTKIGDTWSNVSPTFVASWALTDEINMYGKIANGWKSGGFNSEAANQADFLKSYDPEEIISYEIGLKSRWLDNRLQVNAAVFQNELEEMQFTVFTGGTGASSTVDNAGKATIRGFELELLAKPTESLTISLNYGYLDPEYDEFIDVDPFTGQVGDFKDSRDFPMSAENTASIGLEYAIGNFDWGTLTGRLDWSYQDEYVHYVNPNQNATSLLDSYHLLNGRLTLSEIQVGDGQTLQIAAWGKNLTDEDYRVSTIPLVDMWTVSYFGEPRTYGLELSYQF